MIRSFRVENFKSIQDSEAIELKPLTIFTGPNSSGKSNILEAIAVLAQAARLPKDTTPTLEQSLSRGEFIKYPWPAIELITYKKESNREIFFDIEFGLENSDRRRLEASALSLKYSYRGTPEAKEVHQGIFRDANRLVEVEHQQNIGVILSKLVWPQTVTDQLIWGDEIALSRLLDEAQKRFSERRKQYPSSADDAAMKTLEKAISSSRVLIKELRRIYLISAARGSIETEVRVGEGRRMREPEMAYPPSWVGRTGQYVIEILSVIFGKRKYSSIADKIVEWTEKFGIGKIKAGWGGQFLGSDFEDPVLKVALEMVLASYGSRQLLTMITQMFWSDPGDVVMIEEPEVSLHPESQVLVQELFAEVIKEGKQIICTTHSPFFVLALSRVIKSGAVSRDKIAVYDAEKTSEGTRFRPLTLDEKGFIVGWIPSYLRVEDQLFREWAEGLEQ